MGWIKIEIINKYKGGSLLDIILSEDNKNIYTCGNDNKIYQILNE